ncbi:MAG: FAD binding domain-containing protein [Pyrinomonadaceae bacterium]
MRAYVPGYKLRSPATLGEALEALANEPGIWKPFAGGTDLMVLLEAGKLTHKRYLNIWNLKELRGIEVNDSHVTLGALTTYTHVQEHPVLKTEFPMLCQAASETGSLAIQNRGTVGGNIVNASPAADSPPALLAYDAELELVSTAGARWVPYRRFHTGYKQMLLRPEELLSRIRVARTTKDLQQYYRKVGTRKAQAISKICFAATASTNNKTVADIRIVLGSVAPVPLRCFKTEDSLRGRSIDPVTIEQAKATLAGEIVPIDDVRSTKQYRLTVSLNLLADFLSRISRQA